MGYILPRNHHWPRGCSTRHIWHLEIYYCHTYPSGSHPVSLWPTSFYTEKIRVEEIVCLGYHQRNSPCHSPEHWYAVHHCTYQQHITKHKPRFHFISRIFPPPGALNSTKNCGDYHCLSRNILGDYGHWLLFSCFLTCWEYLGSAFSCFLRHIKHYCKIMLK